jgi:hypothetical protein
LYKRKLKLRYDTVVESTGVLIGFYLPCERTSLGPIITKPISKDIPLDSVSVDVPPVLKNGRGEIHMSKVSQPPGGPRIRAA